MTKSALVLAGLAAGVALSTTAMAQKGALQSSARRGPGRHRRLGRLYRARRDRQGVRLGHRLREETACKVNVKTAGTSDEMVALMNEGGFDLVTASGDASTRLIRGKKVQAINVGLIPSYKTIDPRLQKRPGTTRAIRTTACRTNGLERADVQHHGVQGQAADLVERGVEETTLPDGKSNKGRCRPSTADLHCRCRAVLMKKNPALGIKDPYELNEAQYKAALDLLRAQRKIVGKYWHDAFVQIDDFTNEGVVASSSWQFQANILKSKNRPIATTVPSRVPAAGPTRR